jgi:hypothetical protein
MLLLLVLAVAVLHQELPQIMVRLLSPILVLVEVVAVVGE